MIIMFNGFIWEFMGLALFEKVMRSSFEKAGETSAEEKLKCLANVL